MTQRAVPASPPDGEHGYEISVGIKTFLRPKALELSLRSLCGYSWHEVIIADDSPYEAADEYSRVYAHYADKLPLRVLKLPFDTGLAAGRNSIVRECTSKYLLMLDDDQAIDPSVLLMEEVLTEDTTLGGVSCVWLEQDALRCGAGDIFLEDGYVVKENRRAPAVQHTRGGTRYVIQDFVPNSTLFRMSCLSELAWDPEYKIGREHIDFYVMHKISSRWRFGVSLDTRIRHYPHVGMEEYEGYRRGARLAASEAYFRSKFGVRGVLEGRTLIGGARAFTVLHSSCRLPVRWAKLGDQLLRRAGRWTRVVRPN